MSKLNGNEVRLSPELVQRIIQDEETPRRSKFFDQQSIEIILRSGAVVGSKIEQHCQLHRCMDRARDMIRDYEEKDLSFPGGTVIVAEELTAGQGRFQRPWHAPKGGIWLTLVLVNTLLPANNRLYPLAAGTACCEVLRQYNVNAHVKWVNDVHVNNRKIAGVLTKSMTGPRHNEEYILIGIGINVNNDKFPAELSDLATAVKSEIGHELKTEMLTAQLLAKLAWNIGLLHFEDQRLLADEGLAEKEGREHLLLQRWLQLSDMVGRRVAFGYDVQKDPQYEAVVVGLAADGSIILRLPDNSLTKENSGEITYLD